MKEKIPYRATNTYSCIFKGQLGSVYPVKKPPTTFSVTFTEITDIKRL